mmetsp:Transcript_75376/g.126822  ORF Transcript_75376/g.126822 Transcript_75376/m.126822 type:complete len:222 (-) Transcript_75376:418-1083(-)
MFGSSGTVSSPSLSPQGCTIYDLTGLQSYTCTVQLQIYNAQFTRYQLPSTRFATCKLQIYMPLYRSTRLQCTIHNPQTSEMEVQEGGGGQKSHRPLQCPGIIGTGRTRRGLWCCGPAGVCGRLRLCKGCSTQDCERHVCVTVQPCVVLHVPVRCMRHSTTSGGGGGPAPLATFRIGLHTEQSPVAPLVVPDAVGLCPCTLCHRGPLCAVVFWLTGAPELSA